MNTKKSVPLKLASGIILAAGLLTAGCASTAKGSANSVLGMNSTPVKYTNQAPKTDALVVVRYPASVDNLAKDKYYEAFRSKPIGGSLGKGSNELDSDQVAEGVIAKSNYFAMSLYRELSQKLPKNTVLLSPHVIELDSGGNLTSSPIASMEKIPGAVTVDFTAYSFPNPDKMMGDKPITFGDLISPLVVIQTDHRAMAPTNGVVLASNAMAGSAYAQAVQTARQSFKSLQSGALEAQARPLSFVSHLRGLGSNLPGSQRMTAGHAHNTVQLYPMEKIQFSKQDMLQLARHTNDSIDPARDPLSAKVADRVILALNNIDVNKAGMFKRAASMSRYDSNLAPFTLTGETDADYMARKRMGELLITKERDVLATQSEKIYQASYNSETGKQMRQMLAAEYKLLEERRKIARQQNMATAAAILGGVASISVGSSGNSNGNTQAAGILRDLATVAVAKSMALRQQSKSIGKNFMLAMAPVVTEQMNVQIDLLDGSEEISAASFAELQDKMRTLYSRRVRTMELVASECAFADENGHAGKWLGECSGGQANGRGVGAVKAANGAEIEYYGQAVGGKANGIGYLVVNNGDASYALEGRFAAGMPTGPCTVSKAGKPNQVRRFENGKDVGSAPSNSAPSLYNDSGVKRIAFNG